MLLEELGLKRRRWRLERVETTVCVNKGGGGRGGKTEEVDSEEKVFWPTRRAKKKGLRIKAKGVLRACIHYIGMANSLHQARSECAKQAWAARASWRPASCVVLFPVCFFLGNDLQTGHQAAKVPKACVFVRSGQQGRYDIRCGKSVPLCSISSFRPTFHPQVPARETPLTDCFFNLSPSKEEACLTTP